ncbi:hypothetical protein [Corynebacterium uterequi]|uniref:Uncharacterized protein n=1 Tax=Corynebacterium uterequi TaxID=1072256 RepID=A0A0G3HJP1_9CORY|nr:hypothetical protein [Corynebacterium uterequi]AKK12133.1 hypothetical protein CUTER_10860 [Corynebacterium uterequi]
MIVTTIGIVSIAIGLFSFAMSYLSVMKKKPARRAWTFGLIGLLCLTLIPVTLAVFWAAQTNGT